MKVNDKEVVIKELTRADTRGQLTGLEGEEVQDKLISIATGLSYEEVGNLKFGDYVQLALEFGKVNNLEGFEDFQKPQVN